MFQVAVICTLAMMPSRLYTLFALAYVQAGGAIAADSESVCMTGSCTSGMSMIQTRASPSVEINGDWLVVNKKWYSRKRAHDAWLGRIGLTNGIWTRPVLINFRAPAPIAWLENNVKISTEVTLTSRQARQIAASIDAEIPGMGVSGSAGINHNSTHQASYVLRGLTLENKFKIKHWFNENEDARLKGDYMDMYDVSHKPRIVTTVWVLVSGEDEHARSCTGGHLTLSYGSAQGRAGVTISGDGCRESTWTFSPDSIIAFEASYIKTTRMHWTPPRGRVRDVVADWYWTR